MNSLPQPAPDQTPLTAAGEMTPRPAELYERADVSVRSVLVLFLAVGLGVAVVAFGLWQLVRSFRAAALRQDPQVSPLVERDRQPPGPQLQEQPLHDYQRYVIAQQSRLDSYGWIDRRAKTVHIPIDRAIDLVVERGVSKTFESRPEAKAAAPSP